MPNSTELLCPVCKKPAKAEEVRLSDERAGTVSVYTKLICIECKTYWTADKGWQPVNAATKQWGKIFVTQQGAPEHAPSPVEAVQFKKDMSFDERYRLLKFVRGANVSIYAENLVFDMAAGKMKVDYGDWILKTSTNWYFVGADLFAKTYRAV